MASTRLKAEKAAKIYLEMRGYNILEVNWGLSKNKIDIVAEKNNEISFIEINQRDELSPVPILTQSKSDKMKSAAQAWVDQNKFRGKHVFSSIELNKPGYTVIGFNQDNLL
jgi:Holliday junction resolvase-like predicted endonuclease